MSWKELSAKANSNATTTGLMAGVMMWILKFDIALHTYGNQQARPLVTSVCMYVLRN